MVRRDTRMSWLSCRSDGIASPTSSVSIRSRTRLRVSSCFVMAGSAPCACPARILWRSGMALYPVPSREVKHKSGRWSIPLWNTGHGRAMVPTLVFDEPPGGQYQLTGGAPARLFLCGGRAPALKQRRWNRGPRTAQPAVRDAGQQLQDDAVSEEGRDLGRVVWRRDF